MATNYIECVIDVLVDEDGDWAVCKGEDNIGEVYDAAYPNANNAYGRRLVKLTVKIPVPDPIELSGGVTVNETATALEVKS